jgi:NifU-like protein involved in Fe-S cluster formation
MDYSPDVERRFGSPAAAGDIELGGPGLRVSGDAEDRTLNVWIRFEVQVHDRTIREARFRAYGCPHTIAAASLAAESLRGAPVSALERLDVEGVLHTLNVPREKLGKLLRIEDAMRACAQRLAEPAAERPAER